MLVPELDPQARRRAPELFATATDLSRLTTDGSGRPLGERWLPEELTADVPFDRRPCPYRDDRRGLLMNVSPLPDIQARWDIVLDMAAEVGNVARRAVGQAAPSWLTIWETSKVACAIPFFARRGTSVDTVVSALFKPSIGLAMTAERTMIDGAHPDAPVGATEFVGATGETGVLMYDESACSGPPRMIAQFVEAALSVVDDDRLERPVAPEALAYGLACARLELAKWLYATEVEFVEGGNNGELVSRLRSAAAHRRMTVPPMSATTALAGALAVDAAASEALMTFARGWGAALEALQRDVGRAAGRDDEPPTLIPEDLDHIERYFWFGWRTEERERGLFARRSSVEGRSNTRPTT